MQQTINQRIKIIRQHFNLSQNEFATSLGLKQGSYSDIERGKTGISGTVRRIIENRYNINIGWLDTGKGDMFSVVHDDDRGEALPLFGEDNTQYEVSQIVKTKVPVYDIDFEAGVMKMLLEKNDSFFPIAYLGIPEVSGCDVVIKVRSDNMAPKINAGDWIGIKLMDDWQEWLPMNYIYAITTSDFRIINYVKKGNKPDTFKIISENKEFEEDEIPKKVIREIWSVKTILPFSKLETII